jgi:hypothetical protein
MQSQIFCVFKICPYIQSQLWGKHQFNHLSAVALVFSSQFPTWPPTLKKASLGIEYLKKKK